MNGRLQKTDDDRSVDIESSEIEKQKRKMELLDEQYETPKKIAKSCPISKPVEHLSSSLIKEKPDSEAVEHLSSSMIKTPDSEEVEHLSFSLIERELPPVVTQSVQDGASSSLLKKEDKAFVTQNPLQNNCPVNKLASQSISKENSSSSGLVDLLENKHQDAALSIRNPLKNNKQLNQLVRKYKQRKFSSASGHVDLLENDDAFATQNMLQNTTPVNTLAAQTFIKKSSSDSDNVGMLKNDFELAMQKRFEKNWLSNKLASQNVTKESTFALARVGLLKNNSLVVNKNNNQDETLATVKPFQNNMQVTELASHHVTKESVFALAHFENTYQDKSLITLKSLQNNVPVTKLASQNNIKKCTSASEVDLFKNADQDEELITIKQLQNNMPTTESASQNFTNKSLSAFAPVDLLSNEENIPNSQVPSSSDGSCNLQKPFVKCNSLKSIQSDIKREIIPSSHLPSFSDGFCNLQEPLMDCSSPKSIQDDIGKEIALGLGEEQALIFLQKFRAFLKQENDPLDSMLGALNAMKMENMLLCQAGEPKVVQLSPSSKPAHSIPSEVPLSDHIDPEMFEVGVGKELVNSIGETQAKQFVLKVAEYHATNKEFFACIQNAAISVNLKDKLILSYLSQNFNKTKRFLCKLRLNGCTIGSGDGSGKRKARNACMRNAFRVLMDLASGSSKKSLENVILSQRPSQLSLPDDDIVELYRLHLVISKQKFALSSALSNAVSALKLEKIVRIHNNHFTMKVPNNKPVQIYTWKFTYKEILIAFGADKSAKKARSKGVASAFSKLRNLARCKIENKELIDSTDAFYQSFHLLTKGISEGNVAIVTGHEPVKPHASKQELTQSPLQDSLVEQHGLADSLALNRELFQSSFRDSFALIYYHGRSNTARSILPQSASFCSQTFEYSVCNLSEANPFKLVRIYRVDVLVNQISVGTGLAHSQEEAKSEACKNALEILRKNYYVIQIKQNYEKNCKVIREQVFSSAATSQALPESNIGCKMLKNMGWTGGGLGKCGIVEPISVEAIPNNKRGLGFGGQNLEETEFKKKISSMLKDLSKSNSVSDLVFASDFSSAERKEICRIANGCNLHSSRQGKGMNQFLIVRRKYCLQELLNYLVYNGGSDEKFRLVDASRDAEKLFSSI